MSLFAVPMDARTCHFHRTVGYLENGCRRIRISSRMMMVMRRMMMMLMMMMMVMMTRHCEGAAAWRDSPGIWREFPSRGGGSVSPGRSGIRGPARPFASQSKTQGSPLGGYLSWSSSSPPSPSLPSFTQIYPVIISKFYWVVSSRFQFIPTLMSTCAPCPTFGSYWRSSCRRPLMSATKGMGARSSVRNTQ